MITRIDVGSDFSGVGAFDVALKILGIDVNKVFACDWDKFARQTYIANYGEPDYYPKDVYDREIPTKPLNIYMTSPPCQAFSVAGKRLGKEDPRGVLFFNSLEFIDKNRPEVAIFENVKGLLSHDKQNKKDKIGQTFKEWLDYLGGISVNGVPTEEPIEGSVPYRVFWKVLNSKKHGTPQNRERVFIVCFREDIGPDGFEFPEEIELTKRLKDVLEPVVDEKYFLSEKALSHLIAHKEKHDAKGTGFGVDLKTPDDVATAIRANGALCPTDNHIKIKSATKSGYEVATENDSINFSVPNSETRRGRVGVAQTLDTSCNQGVMVGTWRTHKDGNGFREISDGNSPTIPARAREDGSGQPVISDGYRIRRLTPTECFRLMNFPDSLVINARAAGVSDSQLYKQAGNSIDALLLSKIIAKLPIYKNLILGGI